MKTMIEKADKLQKYLEMLLNSPKRVVLMSPREKDLLYKKHIREANIYFNFINDGFYVLDIGSGTGFPGIPLSILKPKVEFILVDRKKIHISFINEVIKALELKNAKAINIRAEHLYKLSMKFDIICARAVSRANYILKWCLPVIKDNGLVIMGKGRDVDEEILDCADLPYTLVEKRGTLIFMFFLFSAVRFTN